MRGHTAKKGNRYYAVIYEGVDPATGKERHRWYAAGTRKSDADKLVTELVKRRHDGDYRAPEKITLGAYLTDKWLPAQRGQLRPSTLDSYERNVRLHVLPKLGRIGLQQLAPEDLDRFYGELLTDGRRDGRGGLSHKTVRYIHGRRTINLDARTVAVLQAWRKTVLAERLLLGPAFVDNDLVFARPDGTPIHPQAFSQAFDRAVTRLGLPVITLHDLRHTHATLLLRSGVPVKVVSERLGHANPAFTLTVYQHVIPGMQEEAASLFSELIFGSDEPAVTPAP